MPRAEPFRPQEDNPFAYALATGPAFATSM
jgi:hypothetical protein